MLFSTIRNGPAPCVLRFEALLAAEHRTENGLFNGHSHSARSGIAVNVGAKWPVDRDWQLSGYRALSNRRGKSEPQMMFQWEAALERPLASKGGVDRNEASPPWGLGPFRNLLNADTATGFCAETPMQREERETRGKQRQAGWFGNGRCNQRPRHVD
jgi:hypothetical protein